MASTTHWNSAITKFFSSLIMIDVNDGDCYVVDLLHDGPPEKRESWRRFLIDTGRSSETRRGRIFSAIAEPLSRPRFEPWNRQPLDIESALQAGPQLAGMIVTHSDSDHAGNANWIRSQIYSRTEKNLSPYFKVWASPMIKWIKDVASYNKRPESSNGLTSDPKRKVELFEINKAGIKLSRVKAPDIYAIEPMTEPLTCTHPTFSPTLGYTFDGLEQLCAQTDLNIMYRWNITRWDSSNPLKNEYKIEQQWNREISQTELAKPIFITNNQEWSTSPKLPDLSQAQILELALKHELHEVRIIVEVRLYGSLSKRTFDVVNLGHTWSSNKASNTFITGKWLRCDTLCKICEIEEGKGNLSVTGRVRVDGSENYRYYTLKFQDLEGPGWLPSKPAPHIPDDNIRYVGLEDDNYLLFPDAGAFAESKLGHAGHEYIRDFQFLVMRIKLADELTLGNYKAGYANRASILTHFTCSYDENSTRRFRMLFTGDAFQKNLQDSHNEALQQAQRTLGNTKLNIQSKTEPKPVQILPLDGSMLPWIYHLENTRPVYVDVLKVPHHGSILSSDASLYSKLIASVYVMSGTNHHGHPSPAIFETIFHTIIKEDGENRSPSEFNSKATENNKNIKKIECICQRKRPKLIFLSFGYRKSEPNLKGKSGKEAADLGDPEYSESDSDEEIQTNEERAEEEEKSDEKNPTKNYLSKEVSKSNRTRWNGHDDIFGWLENGCPAEYRRTNCKIFVQKKKDSQTRLLFGRDDCRKDELRVEWLEDEWTEIRLGGKTVDFVNSKDDPTAYPPPGQVSAWETPSSTNYKQCDRHQAWCVNPAIAVEEEVPVSHESFKK